MTDYDQTQVLPRSAPVVNKYRLQHGDLDGKFENGRITGAWLVDNTIARHLITAGYLGEFDMQYGLDYLELRNALLGHLNARSNFAILMRMPDSRVSRSKATVFYEEISKAIGKMNSRLVTRALEVSCKPDSAEVSDARYATVYRLAFESLWKTYDICVANAQKSD